MAGQNACGGADCQVGGGDRGGDQGVTTAISQRVGEGDRVEAFQVVDQHQFTVRRPADLRWQGGQR
jgi:hypothetical protein